MTQKDKTKEVLIKEIKLLQKRTAELETVDAERKQAEKTLVETEEKILLLLDSTAEAIYGLDMNGNCTFCNNACLKLLGYKHPDELLGKNMHWQIHAKYSDGTSFPVEECRIFKAFQKGEGTHVDDEVLWCSDGTSFPAEYWSYPQRRDGVVIGAVVTFLNITERKLAEDALRISEEKYRLLIENSHDIIYRLTPDGTFTFVSPAWTALLGHPINQVEGRLFQPFVHPDDLAVCMAWLQKAIETGQRQEGVEYRVRHTDGSWRWHTSSAVPLRSEAGRVIGFEGTARDITERKKAEEALRQISDRLLLASRAGGVGIWDYDVVNNKLIWDDQMYRLYGITPDNFSGAYEAWQTGLHPEDKQRGDNEIKMALGGEKEFNTEFRVLWPDGTIRNIRALAIVQRDSSGKPLRMIGTNWDITDSKRAEKAVKEAAEIKSRFTSMVSHELRSPLGAIKEGINLVVDGSVGDINDRQRHFLSMAKNNIDRLGRLINNVLDFQKIESHKMEFDIRQNDINETVMEVIKTMSILAQNKGLAVITNLGDDLPKIMFDNDRINQVLTNIVSNAIKLTEKGSISINTKKEDNTVHITVQDTGPGIREEDIQKLFQPFEQLDSARDKKKGGSGLGLAISKDIIIAHNGKIWAESEFGKGSAFHFILPIK